MQLTRKESLDHIIDAGEQNVRLCIESGRHKGCSNPACPMDLLFADLDDGQVDGAVKLLSRMVHCNFDGGANIQMFQHLVAEQIKRRELSADVIEIEEVEYGN